MTLDAESDDDQDEPESVQNQRKRIKALERELADTKTQVEANAGAARRVAFQDAGIPDSPQTRFFRENYQGDVSKEAIIQAASEYGFLPEQSETQAHELHEIERQAQALQGGDQSQVEGSDDLMIAEMDEAAAKAPRGTEAQAIAAVMRKYGRTATE